MPETSLEKLGMQFDPGDILWKILASYGLLNRIMPRKRPKPTAGKILQYARQQIAAFRENMGLQLCIFKIGATANPVIRYIDYKTKNRCHVGDLGKQLCTGNAHA